MAPVHWPRSFQVWGWDSEGGEWAGDEGGVEEHTLVLHSPLQLDNHRVPRELREERLRVDGLEGLGTSDEEGSELRGSGPEEIPCGRGGSVRRGEAKMLQCMRKSRSCRSQVPSQGVSHHHPATEACHGASRCRGGVLRRHSPTSRSRLLRPNHRRKNFERRKFERSGPLNRAHLDARPLHRWREG